jgi:DNA-directed RNA polymerase I subunit RPA2
MPDGGGPSRRYSKKGTDKSNFHTLEREENFRFPTESGSTVPILNEFITPALESFNALFDDSGLPEGDTDGKGLLTTSLKDIGERVVFDGLGVEGEASGQAGWGNRLRSKF